MKLRVYLVGFGFMGQMHARIYQALKAEGRDVEIAALVDPFAETSQKAKELGIDAPAFKSLEEAIKAVEGNVVDICLPTDLHASHILTAAKAKKHIFCEKPLGLDYKEAEKAIAEAERADVALQVGHCIRFWPEYQALQQFIASKEAGKLRRLSLLRRASKPAYSRDGWLHQAKRSKGAALDLHIHDTDFMLCVLGQPEAVQSIAREDEGALTYISTQYVYDGVTATAEGGWDLPAGWGFQMAFQAVFENAVVDYDCLQSPTLRIARGADAAQPMPFTKPGIGAAQNSGGNVSDLGGYYSELAYFCEKLAAGKKPEIATGRQSLETLRVALGEIESAETRKQVKF